MNVDFNSTEAINENINNPRPLIRFTKELLAHSIALFDQKKYQEAAALYYKAFFLTRQLSFILPNYPTLGSIFSFSKQFLTNSQAFSQQMASNRLFQTEMGNKVDALFDPLYKFTEGYKSLPPESNAAAEGVPIALFNEVKRILMKQVKTGKVSIVGRRVIFKINGYKGEFCWFEKFISQIDELKYQAQEEDYFRLKIQFGFVQACPEQIEEGISASIMFELIDKFGDKGQIFQEIFDNCQVSMIKLQYRLACESEVPLDLEKQIYLFKLQTPITEQEIKGKAKKCVLALVYRFEKQNRQCYEQYVRENNGNYASMSQSFESLICERKGKPIINLSALGNQKGPSDYLIFYFYQQYDQNQQIFCSSNLYISLKEQNHHCVDIMKQLYQQLNNEKQSQFLQSTFQQLVQENKNNSARIDLQEDKIVLVIDRIIVHIFDPETIVIQDFLTGNNLYNMLESLINSGLFQNILKASERVIARLLVKQLLQLNVRQLLKLITDLNQLVKNIGFQHVIYSLYYNTKDFTVVNAQYNYFYKKNNHIIHVFMVNNEFKQNEYYFDKVIKGFLHLCTDTCSVNLESFFECKLGKPKQYDKSLQILVQKTAEGLSVVALSILEFKIIAPPSNDYSLDYLQMIQQQIQNYRQKYEIMYDVKQQFQEQSDIYLQFGQQNQPNYAQFRFLQQYDFINIVINLGMKKFLPIAANKDILYCNIQQFPEYLPFYSLFSTNQTFSLSTDLKLSTPHQKILLNSQLSQNQKLCIQMERELTTRQLERKNKYTELLDQLNQIIHELLITTVNISSHQISFNLKMVEFTLYQKLEDQSYLFHEHIKQLMENWHNKSYPVEEYKALLELTSPYPLFAISEPIIFDRQYQNNQLDIVQQQSEYIIKRNLQLQQLFQADSSLLTRQNLFSYIANRRSQSFSFYYQYNILQTHDQTIRLQNYKQKFVLMHQIYCQFIRQVPIYTEFNFKQVPLYQLVLQSDKLQEKYRFNTDATTFDQFKIDLGVLFDKTQTYTAHFDQPSITFSFNLEVNNIKLAEKYAKKCIRYYSSVQLFSSSEEFTPFLVTNFNCFDNADSIFVCNEERRECKCVKCKNEDKCVINYQNRCRCGGEHSAPFGHGMLKIVSFQSLEGNCSKYLRYIVKLEKIASILNYLSEFYEICGKIKHFSRADLTIQGYDDGNVKTLRVVGFNDLEINIEPDQERILLYQNENIELYDTIKQYVGQRGVVYGRVFYSEEGGTWLLLDNHWQK